MRLTIDIPDHLAAQLEPEREHLVEIIARGLRRSSPKLSDLRREVISFFAGQPDAKQIVEFRPSSKATERMQDLLRRNTENRLTQDELAELDEMCEVDRFVSSIKTEVLLQNSGKA
jgi:hypothetical protein